jgi:hypothetical protein
MWTVATFVFLSIFRIPEVSEFPAVVFHKIDVCYSLFDLLEPYPAIL